PDPANMMVCTEPWSSSTTVTAPAPTTAAAAHTAPITFTLLRLIGGRFVFIPRSSRAYHRAYCIRSVSYLTRWLNLRVGHSRGTGYAQGFGRGTAGETLCARVLARPARPLTSVDVD